MCLSANLVITPHTHERAGDYVIGASVHLPYVLYDQNDTLAVDSPFQTLEVDFSSNL